MLDLLIHNAALPDGRQNMSIAVQGGRIAEVTEGLNAPAHETVDAGGLLLSPPFVDAHFHLDSALSYGQPRVNDSGTLLEGIALWGELKPQLTHDAIVERALAYCDWAVAQGAAGHSLAMSTPATASLLPVHALLDVQKPRGALPRPATGRLSARRRAAQPRRAGQPQACAGPGRGRGGRHSAFRAHHAPRAAESVRSSAKWPPSVG